MLRKRISEGIELKATAGGEIEGYANVSGVRDRHNEIVMSGAFKDAVAAFKAGKRKIPLMDNHRIFGGTDAVIGKVTELKEDTTGLWFKAVLASTQAAQDVRAKIREGMLDSLSIGYAVLQDEARRDGVRLLKKLDLREISVVVFPANESARITGVKGTESLTTATKARLARLDDAAHYLEYAEGALEELDRKERMLATMERLAGATELTAEQCGWIL
jgi:hypothetical protein